MKTIYILLTRSGTLLSNLVYHLTGAQYTHVSLAFDEDLSTLYSSTRKNGLYHVPGGPQQGVPQPGLVFAAGEYPLRALCAGSLGGSLCPGQTPRGTYDEPRPPLPVQLAGAAALLAAHPVAAPAALFLLPVRQRGAGKERCHGAAQAQHPDAPQRLHHPAGPALRVRGALSGLPQRQNMDFGGDETVVSVYLGLALGLVKAGVRQIF